MTSCCYPRALPQNSYQGEQVYWSLHAVYLRRIWKVGDYLAATSGLFAKSLLAYADEVFLIVVWCHLPAEVGRQLLALRLSVGHEFMHVWVSFIILCPFLTQAMHGLNSRCLAALMELHSRRQHCPLMTGLSVPFRQVELSTKRLNPLFGVRDKNPPFTIPRY